MSDAEAYYKAAKAADDNFHVELVRQFGRRDACDMRYHPDMHDARTRAAREACIQASQSWAEYMRTNTAREGAAE